MFNKKCLKLLEIKCLKYFKIVFLYINLNLAQGQIIPDFRSLINESIIFMSKVVRLWLKNCVLIPFLLLDIAWLVIFDKILLHPLLLLATIFVCERLKANA